MVDQLAGRVCAAALTTATLTTAGPVGDAAFHRPRGLPHPGLALRSDDTYVVGREKVREFARTLLAMDPAHHDVDAARRAGYPDVVAPPTFGAVVTAALIRDMLTDPRSGIDVGTRMPIHVNEKITVTAPILAGDALTASLTVTGVSERGDAVFLDTETSLRTTAGEPRSTVTSTILLVPTGAPAGVDRPEK